MLKAFILFGNLYSDRKRITVARLVSHATDSVNRFMELNINGEWKAIIDIIILPLDKVKNDLSEIEINIAKQRGLTQTTDEVVIDLHATMRDSENEIIYKLGGKNAASVLEFYPHGVSEYLKITKTEMLTVTDRLFKATNNHAAVLGVDLANKLKGFKSSWATAHDGQSAKKTDVSTNRTDRDDNRLELELAMTKAVHTVGLKYPGDVEKCNTFFDFNLLYSHNQHGHDDYEGSVAAGTTALVVNVMMKKSWDIEVTNTGTNAALKIWIGATANEAAPATAIEILPGETLSLHPTELGDLAHTFLLLKNESAVNATGYEVSIIH